MEEKIQQKISSIIAARGEACEDLEIYYKNCRSLSLFFNGRGIVQDSLSKEEGFAIRFWDTGGLEYFYHSSHLEADLQNIIKNILSTGRKRERMSIFSRKLPSKREFIQPPSIFCPLTTGLSTQNRHNFVEKIIALMKTGKNREKKLRSGHFSVLNSHQFIANSRGFEGGFRKSEASVSLNTTLPGNDGICFVFASSSILDLDPERIFKNLHNYPYDISIERSPRRKNPINRIHKAVFSSQASSELLRCLTPHLINCKNDSSAMLELSKNLTITDDPTLERGVNSAPFDGAGFPVQKTEIIRNGSFIHPLRSIVRASYTDPPARGATNLSIEPGCIVPRKMVEDMREGFYIASLKPVFSACGNGRFSAVGSGFPVQRGTIMPFSQRFYISEDIFDIFQSILMIGNDFQFHFRGGCFGSASMMVEKAEILPIHN